MSNGDPVSRCAVLCCQLIGWYSDEEDSTSDHCHSPRRAPSRTNGGGTGMSAKGSAPAPVSLKAQPSSARGRFSTRTRRPRLKQAPTRQFERSAGHAFKGGRALQSGWRGARLTGERKAWEGLLQVATQ